MIRRLAEKLWSASRNEPRIAHTVVLKQKTSEFKILTRSHTATYPPSFVQRINQHCPAAAGARAPSTPNNVTDWSALG